MERDPATVDFAVVRARCREWKVCMNFRFDRYSSGVYEGDTFVRTTLGHIGRIRHPELVFCEVLVQPIPGTYTLLVGNGGRGADSEQWQMVSSIKRPGTINFTACRVYTDILIALALEGHSRLRKNRVISCAVSACHFA